jgi:hypothetical protein
MSIKYLPIIAAILAFAPDRVQAAPPLGAIVAGTPPWVWLLLAALIFLGWLGSRDRTVSPWRIAATPLVFLIWGVVALEQRITVAPIPAAAGWGLAAVVFAILGTLSLRRATLLVDRGRRLVRLAGSWVPLVRNVVIFCAKYAMAVALALGVDAREVLTFADMALSGMAFGYFGAWSVWLARQYRTAPSVDLAPLSQRPA